MVLGYRHAFSYAVIHFSARIDFNPVGGETADINHQGMSIMDVRMAMEDWVERRHRALTWTTHVVNMVDGGSYPPQPMTPDMA